MPPVDQSMMSGFVMGMWHWGHSVFRPAQRLKRAGLYRGETLGCRPVPHARHGHGPELSSRYATPVLLGHEPGNYESVREFDHYAPGYEDMVQPFTGPIVDETVALMHPYVASDARILDPSAGPGRNAIRLASDLVPEGEVIAADLSRGMVETAFANARAAGRENMAFFQADVTKPPEAFVGYFDAIFCCLSFHHYPNGLAAARAFRRVLVPGGTCFIADAGVDWFNRLTEPISLLLDPGFVRHRSGREFYAILREAGFSQVFWTEILPGIGVTVGVA